MPVRVAVTWCMAACCCIAVPAQRAGLRMAAGCCQHATCESQGFDAAYLLLTSCRSCYTLSASAARFCDEVNIQTSSTTA